MILFNAHYNSGEFRLMISYRNVDIFSDIPRDKLFLFYSDKCLKICIHACKYISMYQVKAGMASCGERQRELDGMR